MMKKEETGFELPSLNLKCAKMEQGERVYVIELLKKAIYICDNNITSKVKGNMLLNEEYFGKIYTELMNISKDKKWFWKVKSKELNILNQDKFIYDIFMDNPDKKVINSQYYRLNYIERSLVFLEMDTLAMRSVNFNEINTVNWKYIRNGFVIILHNIINGVANKEINKITIKIREDGLLIDCVFSYGRPLVLKNEFNPNKICEEMFFYKRWRGQLYSCENKLIKEVQDYTKLCEDFNLNFKIDGVEENSSVNVDINSVNYVDILERGIELKHLGKYEEAKEMYIKAIHVDNTHPNGYYNLGKVLYILGDYKASAKAYKASFERGICELQQSMQVGHTRLDTSSLYVHLGHALLDEENKEGQYSECIKKYEEGLDPRRVEDYKPNRGQIRTDVYNEYDKMCVESAKAYLAV